MIVAVRQQQTGKNGGKQCRFSVDLTASYMIYNNWYECEIIDASGYGAAIKTRQFFVKNDTLKLRIMFDDRTAVIDALVTHHSGMTTGILFSDRDAGRMASFLDILDAALEYKIKYQAREFFRKIRN